ncbi:hypothetical protein B0H16DRAFT_1721612 [Mycena metata]|uniref:Uncharacterized protein n=1 Tax=Mycena metata TaxID=1033252 RepID=A0AAD7NF38_9AGAR|nr:hypothetical protein B0H16DRAFT_1721612 [Mycena metata]
MAAVEATALSWAQTMAQLILNIVVDHARVLVFFALFAAPKSICSYLLLTLSFGLISARIGAFNPFLQSLAFALALSTALMRVCFPRPLADPHRAAPFIACFNIFTPWIWDGILSITQIEARMSVEAFTVWTLFCAICTVATSMYVRLLKQKQNHPWTD